MPRPLPLLGLLIVVAAGTTVEVRGEVTVRECISLGLPSGQAYRLAPNSGWKMIGTLEFNHVEKSDYLVNAVIFVGEGTIPDTRVEYQFMLDGTPYGWFTRRTPDNFPTTQTLRTIIPDVGGGIHTLGIRARNLSTGNPVNYSGFWLSPLLLDAGETSAHIAVTTPLNAGSSWQTLVQQTVAVPGARMAYVAGFATVSAGTPTHDLEYRVLRDGIELVRFKDAVPEQFPDGVHLARIDTGVGSGSRTYALQARSPSGSAVTFGARSINLQTLPQFTVFAASNAGVVTVANDDQFHDLVVTNWQQISPLSRGSWSTDGWGHAFLTHTGPATTEAEVKFELEFQYGGSLWEVGQIGLSPSGETVLGANNSDWEQLGLNTTDYYRMKLQARGLCNGTPAMQIQNPAFQVMVTPDNTRYTGLSCAVSPFSCCANNYPECLVYSCQASGELPVVAGPPRNCF